MDQRIKVIGLSAVEMIAVICLIEVYLEKRTGPPRMEEVPLQFAVKKLRTALKETTAPSPVS